MKRPEIRFGTIKVSRFKVGNELTVKFVGVTEKNVTATGHFYHSFYLSSSFVIMATSTVFL